ncbi:XTP/dITP diphosphatase [Evansella cellulosilytica]|uniref:dITP/XTP pyrophosphatase n=1 Tax=Evansella cellulosilytica (strain ATCC 21833 / DSM 2522 / FERM P-1141 / JCM 9156 / N-4) TaxID=649639 RepID=E6TZT2_EVAC2|nr:XTP/dITP diphosphatase [Evansella cellulosilytica]ADU31388.1 non-canonical purine NTP pyrophosphatase, rdgB/HAM1 family [Evansella cellulosilytica DSM 2522]
MSTSLFVATKNEGKVKEFTAFFQERGIEVKSLLDLEEDIDVLEDGDTFEDNAIKKAETIGKKIGQIVISDDSGLEVDALDGRPGVYSARYAGQEKNDAANNAKLLKELEGISDNNRTAQFVCVIAVYIPGQETRTIRGTCKGIIATAPRGNSGFGYDPVFYLPHLKKTMAELSREEKNKLSHRANAMLLLQQQWDKWSL